MINDEDSTTAYVNRYDQNKVLVTRWEKVKVDSTEYLDNFGMTKEIFDKEREENDVIRIQARAFSTRILQSCNNYQEKRFACFIANAKIFTNTTQKESVETGSTLSLHLCCTHCRRVLGW